MATSLINTECKRYGCMKNLLACYANCRYNSRCDDLRNEILPKLEQATNDINSYRRERELSSIEIQLLKRGLKFVDVASLQKNLAQSRKAKSTKKRRPKRSVTARQTSNEKAKPESPRARIKAVTRVEKPSAIANKRIEPVPEKTESLVKKRLAILPEKTRPIVKKRVKTRRKKLKPETHFKMVKKTKDSATDNLNLSTEANQSPMTNAPEKTATTRRRKSAGQEAAAKKKKRMFIILDGERSALVDERGLMAKLLAGVSPNARYFEATEIELRLQIAHKK
jgi:hypothetical protein